MHQIYFTYIACPTACKRSNHPSNNLYLIGKLLLLAAHFTQYLKLKFFTGHTLVEPMVSVTNKNPLCHVYTGDFCSLLSLITLAG